MKEALIDTQFLFLTYNNNLGVYIIQFMKSYSININLLIEKPKQKPVLIHSSTMKHFYLVSLFKYFLNFFKRLLFNFVESDVHGTKRTKISFSSIQQTSPQDQRNLAK